MAQPVSGSVVSHVTGLSLLPALTLAIELSLAFRREETD